MKQTSRTLKLEAGPHAGAVRFLAGRVELAEGRNASWVTLTRTGRFADPRYGSFEISRDMLLAMVSNFEKGTYGQDIFIDVAHRPENGAAGKVIELQLDGGKLRALVEWTPYGLEAIQGRGYQYLSAEYSENWRDNEKGQHHGPVLLGAGLTVRPVVKGLDPIQLSEDYTGKVPTLLAPELQSRLILETHTMWKQLSEQLKALLAGIIMLAEPVRAQLLEAFETAVKPVTEEVQAKALMETFAATGKKLAESHPNQTVKLDISLPSLTPSLTADDVNRMLAEETTRQQEATRKLAETRDARVKLLSDTIGAAEGLSVELKKELTEAVSDLITPDMTEEQVKKLAQAQIASGNKLAAAQQLSAMGFVRPGGNVHITVDDSNAIKALQEEIDRRLFSGVPDYRRYSLSEGQRVAGNEHLVNEVLARFDADRGAQLHEEARRIKRLAAGDSVVSDVAVPAIFERTVIREALYQMVGLQFCDVGTVQFSGTAQLPYSYRDTTAAGLAQTRKYEGQSIARAAVKQALETVYPIPQKLAFEVSDELRYLSGNGQIDFDIVAENTRNAARIIGEDSEKLIFDSHLDASDQYSKVDVTNEATATANGTNKIFVLDNFPVVRPVKIYDLQGNQVGSTLYPVTVKVNNVTLVEYDGTGTQSAGTYYSINYNLGEVSIVNQLGALVAPTNTHAVVCSYTYTTNVYKFDTDLGSLKTDEKWDDFLYRYGLRKNVIEQDRYYMAGMGLMSGTVRTQIEQARQFSANYQRAGTDLSSNGNLGRIKDVPNFRTTAPGLAMGDARIIIGERGVVRFRMMKPWMMGQLENQKDANGRFTGKKEAYGDQYVVVHCPTLLKGGLTSMVLYSAAARVDRAS